MRSEYRADTFALQAMAGYAAGVLTPEAGVRYTNVRQRGYVNALGVKMAGKTSETWTGVAGARYAKDFRAGKTTLTPDAKIALTYDFARDSQDRSVSLANGTGYVTDGKAMSRAGLEVGAGVSFKAGASTDVGVSYEGKFKRRYTDHTALLNVKYNF